MGLASSPGSRSHIRGNRYSSLSLTPHDVQIDTSCSVLLMIEYLLYSRRTLNQIPSFRTLTKSWRINWLAASPPSVVSRKPFASPPTVLWAIAPTHDKVTNSKETARTACTDDSISWCEIEDVFAGAMIVIPSRSYTAPGFALVCLCAPELQRPINPSPENSCRNAAWTV